MSALRYLCGRVKIADWKAPLLGGLVGGGLGAGLGALTSRGANRRDKLKSMLLGGGLGAGFGVLGGYALDRHFKADEAIRRARTAEISAARATSEQEELRESQELSANELRKVQGALEAERRKFRDSRDLSLDNLRKTREELAELQHRYDATTRSMRDYLDTFGGPDFKYNTHQTVDFPDYLNVWVDKYKHSPEIRKALDRQRMAHIDMKLFASWLVSAKASRDFDERLRGFNKNYLNYESKADEARRLIENYEMAKPE